MLLTQRKEGSACTAVSRRVVLVAPFGIHIADGDDQAVEVAQRRIPLPLAGRVIAEHDLVARIAQPAAAVAQLVGDRSNVFRLPRQKQPSWADTEGRGGILEPLLRIALRGAG